MIDYLICAGMIALLFIHLLSDSKVVVLRRLLLILVMVVSVCLILHYKITRNARISPIKTFIIGIFPVIVHTWSPWSKKVAPMLMVSIRN